MQVNQQMQREAQYRQSMHNLHKNGMPPAGMTNLMPGGNAASPSASDSAAFGQDGPQSRPGTAQFGPGGPNNRLMQNKQMGMPPPPSPSQNVKKEGTEGALNNGRLDASPQAGQGQQQSSALGSAPTSTHTGPSTPSSTGNMTAPSPSAILNNPPTNVNQQGATTDLLNNFFTFPDVDSAALSEFDATLFSRHDGDLNFERDFGEWFNPDSVGLDMK